MTVKELKKILSKVPDDAEVMALVDSWESHYENVWAAGYEEEEEDGEVIKRFTINC
jgi:hypothetical protein